MANIGSIFKSEISRLARKELRAAVGGLKKSANTHRSEIAALKRRIQSLELELRRVSKARARPAPAVADGDESTPATSGRFSAKALASQRKRLGLSAHEVGLLVGASSQSVYNWEQAKARPRARHMPALSALKTLGKKEAQRLISERKAA